MVTVRLYLDVRSKLRDGTSPMKIALTNHGCCAYLPTGLHLLPAHWDSDRQIVRVRDDKKALDNFLTQRKLEVEAIIRELVNEGALRGKTITQIKNMVAERLEPEDTSANTFVSHYNKVIEKHRNAKTRRIYSETLTSIRKYDPKLDVKSFEDLDVAWLKGYEKFILDQGFAQNYAAIHLRNIRAAFNDAIEEGVTDYYPFRKFKIKSEATRKRSVSAKRLKEIFDTPVKPALQKYIDAFKLTFLLIGINSVDLLGLKPENLKEGRIEYRRAKTKRLYNIKVEPEALELIERYKGTTLLLSFGEGKVNYQRFMNKMNYYLNELFDELTGYVARHSWATIAANDLDIPKDTIAAALGHGAYTVTDVYIDFDQRKVDEANRKVLDWVLYGKK